MVSITCLNIFVDRFLWLTCLIKIDAQGFVSLVRELVCVFLSPVIIFIY